jgi:hypothetical protein
MLLPEIKDYIVKASLNYQVEGRFDLNKTKHISGHT